MEVTVGIERLIEVESQWRFNELRSKHLDDRTDTIGWWLTALTVVLGFFGIVAVVGGYISFDRFRKIEAEAKEAVGRAENAAERADIHAKDAERFVGEIKTNLEQSAEMLRDKTAETADENPEETKQVIDEVLEDPHSSPIDKAIARAVSLQQEDNWKQASEIWRSVALVTDDPGLAARAWFSVGYLLRDNNPTEQIAAYDESIRLDPSNPVSYNNRGIARGKLDRDEEAIVDFSEAIRRNPDFASAYNNRGISKGKLGRYKEAIADYDKAIRLKLDFAEAYANRGKTKILLGHRDEAQKDLNTGFVLAQETGNVKLASGIEQDLRSIDNV